MEFWIVIGILWFVLGRRVGRGCGGVGKRRHRGRLSGGEDRSWTDDGQESWPSGYRERVARAREEATLRRRGHSRASAKRVAVEREAPAVLAAADPVSRLQREWIEGRITDHEYEQSLDAIYSKRPTR